MERAEFEALVIRMEGLAAEQPAAYRRRVFGLAALGYGYLLFVVLALLVLCALAVMSVAYLKAFGVKLVIVVGALLFAVLRSLWVKQEPPGGESVTPSDAPQLFGLLEEMQQRLQTPAVHTVLVTPDFNAAVSQVPRLGLFGGHRNFLLLGLPQTYWPAIHAAAKDFPQPAFEPYSGFVAQAIREVPKSDLDRWHDAAVNQVTSHVDTHPSLGDRLKAIGRPAEFAPPISGEGADQLLGSALAKLETTFDSRWKERIADSWRKYHDETQLKRMRLATLRADRAAAPLNEECSLELAALEEDVGAGAEVVLPLLRDTVERFPDSKAAQFALARHFLLVGEEEGARLMEGILGEDPTLLLAGSELLRNYFGQRGDLKTGRKWHDRHVDEAVRLQRARRRLFLSDRFTPHELDFQTVSKLIGKLKSVSGIKRVYLVRKVDMLSPNRPLYVLGVKSTGFFQLHSRKRAAQVVKEITDGVIFPGETIILNVDGNMYRFARKMRRVKYAKLV